MNTVAIIGGGAAGLAAAISAGETLRKASAAGSAGFAVVVYEADERVGRSILATGNGRCNFSNARVCADDYRNGEFVGAALWELQRQHVERRGKVTLRVLEEDPVHEFFADRGLLWREEADGRLYPATGKASTVLDVLRAAAHAHGVREACGCKVVGVDAPRKVGGCFTLRMADGAFERADAVVVAVGGRATQALVPGDLAWSEPRALLGPLKTDTSATKGLDNVRVRCAVELRRPGASCDTPLAREEGELLFRAYGASGIAVFNLSRHVRPGDVLSIDFLPFVRPCDMERFLFARRKRMARNGLAPTCEALLRGMLLPQVAQAVLREARLAPQAPPDRPAIDALGSVLKAFPLVVKGIGDERQCQVRRGGFDVAAFRPETMEACGCEGLFVAGEALDVDAPCGGYNLHWAWASGLLAGRAAAQRVLGVGVGADARAEAELQVGSDARPKDQAEAVPEAGVSPRAGAGVAPHA